MSPRELVRELVEEIRESSYIDAGGMILVTVIIAPFALAFLGPVWLVGWVAKKLVG